LDLGSGMLTEVSTITLPGRPGSGANFSVPPLALAADPLGRFVYVAGGSWQQVDPQVHGYLRSYSIDGAAGTLKIRSEASLEDFVAFQKVKSARTIPTRLTATAGRVYATFQYQEGWQGTYFHDHCWDYWTVFDVASSSGDLSSTVGAALGGTGPAEQGSTIYFPIADPETGWVVEVSAYYSDLRTLEFNSAGVVRELFKTKLPVYDVLRATMAAGQVIIVDDNARLSMLKLDRVSGSLGPFRTMDRVLGTGFLEQDNCALVAGPGNMLAVSAAATYAPGTPRPATGDEKTLRLYSVSDDGALMLLDQSTTGGAPLAFHPLGKLLLRATSGGIEIYDISDRRLRLLRTEPIHADGIAITPGRS
jgi:hypothetical protein